MLIFAWILVSERGKGKRDLSKCEPEIAGQIGEMHAEGFGWEASGACYVITNSSGALLLDSGRRGRN